jgi:rubrerythrin
MFKQIKACLDGVVSNEECDEIFLNTGIMAELEAINLYNTIAENTQNKKIKELMKHISDEERVHVGEFKTLLYRIQPKTLKLEKEGEKENE